MLVTFPELRVGEPIRFQNLSVFPLFTSATGSLDYLLSDEAIRLGMTIVREVSESGSVPNLVVVNQGDSPVLFLEGEELQGAKQNRILNTTVLIAGKTETVIPVSCVERGRWGYRSPQLGSSGTRCSSKILYALKSSVGRSLRGERGHRSDQIAVWAEVDRVQACLGTHSPTAALADVFDSYQGLIRDYREQLGYVDGAVGAVMAIAAQVVSLDFFDRPATCAKVWGRLLSGVVLDALESRPSEAEVTADDAQRSVASLNALGWERVPSIGLGDEYRVTTSGRAASALVCDGVPLHVSLVTFQPA